MLGWLLIWLLSGTYGGTTLLFLWSFFVWQLTVWKAEFQSNYYSNSSGKQFMIKCLLIWTVTLHNFPTKKRFLCTVILWGRYKSKKKSPCGITSGSRLKPRLIYGWSRTNQDTNDKPPSSETQRNNWRLVNSQISHPFVAAPSSFFLLIWDCGPQLAVSTAAAETWTEFEPWWLKEFADIFQVSRARQMYLLADIFRQYWPITDIYRFLPAMVTV